MALAQRQPPWPIASGDRAVRATGCAMLLSSDLLPRVAFFWRRLQVISGRRGSSFELPPSDAGGRVGTGCAESMLAQQVYTSIRFLQGRVDGVGASPTQRDWQ